MAYDETNVGILRDELAQLDGVTERRMFGGLCFMLRGNMLCGVHKNGGMARVGKELEAEAQKIQGVSPLSFTGRKMGGMVDVASELFDNKETLREVLKLAIAYVGTLPEK